MTIDHLLFDADGVLQTAPDGWQAAIEPVAGERWHDFARDLAEAEQPTLRGEGDILEALDGVARRYEIARPAAELHAELWGAVEVVPRSIELVRSFAAAGYGVHLGTNQHDRRAVHLRREFGYEDVFDTLAISCELGVAKPDADFFDAAVALTGSSADRVLFVDDSPDNVEGAREAGLVAEQWSLEQGHDRLVALLAHHGVRPATPGDGSVSPA